MAVDAVFPKLLLFATFSLLLLRHTFAVGVANKTLLDQLFSDFDKDVRPNQGAGPLLMEIDLYVESFGNIAEADMEYTVFGYFRHYWSDKRLANKSQEPIKLKGSTVEHAWLPDTYISNSRQTNLRVKDSEASSTLFIYPSGDLFYSKGVMIVASCDLMLHDFPMDTQKCSLTLGSYAHSMNDIIYKWRNDYVTVERKNIAQFIMTNVQQQSEVKRYISGNYTQLTISFSFRRRVVYYVIQAYLPDSLVVAISWIVFWLDQDDMGSRVGLGISSILTIMFLLGAVNSSLPRVSYPKAIDWYLIVSFCLVFLVLVECIVVYILRQSTRAAKKAAPEKGLGLERRPDGESLPVKSQGSLRVKMIGKRQPSIPIKLMSNSEPAIATRSWNRDPLLSSNQNMDNTVIDKSTKTSHGNEVKEEEGCESYHVTTAINRASRCLFPCVFILFNIFYWYFYLKKQSDLSQDN